MRVLWIVPVVVLVQPPMAQSQGGRTHPVPPPAVARPIPVFTRSRAIAQLGFPSGLSLDGTVAERTLRFSLPGNAPLDSARLSLRVRFSPGAVPQSNLQVFVNDVRRGVILRQAADSAGLATLDIPMAGAGLAPDFATVRLRSSVAVSADRCLDERVAAAFVEVDPASSFTYYAQPGAIGNVRQVWASLPDTVTISLPARELTADEFRAAAVVARAVSREGHGVAYTTLPSMGDVTVAPLGEVASITGLIAPPPAGANLGVISDSVGGMPRSGIFLDPRQGAVAASLLGTQWAPLATAATADIRVAADPDSATTDPTLQDLGASDLLRSLGAETSWRIPIDLRDLPVGRVPSRLSLQLVTSPNTNDRQLVASVFWNGILVHSADMVSTGAPQTLDVRLPPALITMRNELRVTMQRHLRSDDQCAQGVILSEAKDRFPGDASIPAQLMPTSRVMTTAANSKAATFSTVAANLSSASSIYLPRAALSAPAEWLPIVVRLGRAFWGERRAPHPVFYDRTARAPTGAFVVVGRMKAPLIGPVAQDSGRFRVRRKESGETLFDVADIGDWSIAQVVQWNEQSGMQLIVPADHRSVADWPDAYGNNTLSLAKADSSLFAVNTAGPDAALLFNDGPTVLERLRGDWILWSLFGVLLVAPILVLGVRAVIRRTPRRRIAARGQRPAAPPASARSR